VHQRRAPWFSIYLSTSIRNWLAGIGRIRNAFKKPFWCAKIVLLSAEGVGTVKIIRRTGTAKTCIWRWQERFAESRRR